MQTPCPNPLPLPPPPTAPRGVVRNNILHASFGAGSPAGCQTSYAVAELDALSDPRIFENNDLWPSSATALYRDEDATDHTTQSAVNGMLDITTSGNLSQSPGFSGTFNFPTTPATAPGSPPPVDIALGAGSACIDVGTSAGLPPPADFYGASRPAGAGYDVGADEY
jgi:hypothetical protein